MSAARVSKAPQITKAILGYHIPRMVWQLWMLLGWSCFHISKGSSRQPSQAKPGSDKRGAADAAAEPQGGERVARQGKGRSRPAALRGARHLQQGDRTGEVPLGQEFFQLWHLLPFLPPPVSRRRGTPHGRLGPREHLGREQRGAGSDWAFPRRCLLRRVPCPAAPHHPTIPHHPTAPHHPAIPHHLPSLTAPPPLTILRPGPGSALRRRRRCRGNGGTAEGQGERAPANDRHRPQGSASPSAGRGLRGGRLSEERAGSSPKVRGASSPRLWAPAWTSGSCAWVGAVPRIWERVAGKQLGGKGPGGDGWQRASVARWPRMPMESCQIKCGQLVYTREATPRTLCPVLSP